jgi:Protein of unknown function (DUF1592)/Protein of unknown function (DUF1588)/Protein of unknown function (DUF1587)/Protein of unknown function (DUF1595)/Protein of unknown function (DUF1585)
VRACLLFALALPLVAQPDASSAPSARRLNRYEYNATIRDLLAVPFQPTADFPADDSDYGFDNIASVLSLSPALMEKYLAAAETIAHAAVFPSPPPVPSVHRYAASDFRLPIDFDGDYDILIAVRGRPDPVRAGLSIDGVPAAWLTLHGDAPEHMRSTEIRVRFGRGDPELSVELLPNGPPAGLDATDERLSPPHLGYIEIRGPYNPAPAPLAESYRRVFLCGHAPGHNTMACARSNLAELARRAYRRPITQSELDGLVHFVEQAQQQGGSIEDGMALALEAILVSPQFLFRIESAGALDDFQFASRLSYFLWSSMPDDELFELALEHRLRDPEVLRAQVHRMLLDPKSRSLVENFGSQWLETRNLPAMQPDPAKFPQFTPALRHDMQRETELFFQYIIREDRPISDFLAANYTFLNQRLAVFYGIPGVIGPAFRRVELTPDSHRGGILTQASVLTVSSYPSRTSPVLRGKWILETLLDSPPPPPPPNVPNLDEKAIGATMSMRQQLELHRANPACRVCHARMDPLGFGLENYDAIGEWRTHDGNFPVDSSGALPDGRIFTGPDELRQILLHDQDRFAKSLGTKLFTYALGRKMVMSSAHGNEAFSQLVEDIVTSPQFEELGALSNATH